MKLSAQLLSATALAAMGLPSSAALVNLYTFNDGTATDSVGGDNGVLVGTPGLTSGVIDLSSNAGKNNNTAGLSYVDLPNGLITDAVNAGAAGQFSVSIWFSVAINRDWSTPFSLGTTEGGENANSGANNSPYIQLIPDTGDAANTMRLTTHGPGLESGASRANGATAALNPRINVIGSFVNAGDFTFYVDGVAIATAPVASNLNLTNFVNDNNWLGRGQWGGDQAFVGSIDEFAIYDTAVDATEAAAIFTAGPVPEPTATVLGLMGAAALATRRRRA